MTEPNGGAPSAEPTAAAPQPETAPGASPSANASGDSPARPDYLPEKFWDAEKGAPRVEEMAKSYGELERFRMGRTERAPADYTLPAAFDQFAEQVNDDAMKGLKELAAAEGYSQQGFEKLLQWAYGDPGAHMEQLKGEFGDKLDETLEACRLYARTFGDHEDVVRQLSSTSAGVKFLNAMRLKAADQALPGQPGQGTPKVTQAELEAKMRDPRYWRDKDPSFIGEVTRGFQELYGSGQVRTAAINPGDQVGAPV